METFIKKITSRKFLLTLVGVITGLAVAFGVDASEIQDTVTGTANAIKQVVGILGAFGCVIAYNGAEAKVDAAAAAAQQVALPVIHDMVLDGIAVEDLDDDQLRSLLQQCGFAYTENMTREEMLAALDETSNTAANA